MTGDRGRPPHAPLHVLVIGGGIGGLCLAQGLTKVGISVAVYERDRSAQSRAQGYRLWIKGDGSRALCDCLPEHLFALCLATSIKPALRMVALDHQLHQTFARPLPHPHAGPDPASFGVNRLTLREILLAGLDGRVHFGKTFTRCEQADKGRVRAYFSDGTSASGDLLVGADGTNSAVRPLVAPEAQLDDLHHILYGSTPLTPATLDWLPAELVDAFNTIVGPEGVRMSVAICRMWTSAAAAGATLAPGLQLTEVPDDLSWTLSLPAGSREVDGPALQRLAQRLLQPWHPAVRRIVDEADVAATIPLTVRAARPVAAWRPSNVTLLGDAIHTMTPARGEGANTALRDAALLCQTLSEVVATGRPLLQATAQYEAELRRYGFAAVALSREHPFAAGPSIAVRTTPR
jgi:2-polyprenyl-6-methoxyphenol hydroxylase-like FAD-dependent oxidoreductase